MERVNNAAEFRLPSDEVHGWAGDILSINGGSALDAESRVALDFLRVSRGYADNELVVDLVPSEEQSLEALAAIRERTIEGLAELSEGLQHYGDVMVIVRREGEQTDQVVQLVGLELDGDSYQVRLIDGAGNCYSYREYQSLLLPLEVADE